MTEDAFASSPAVVDGTVYVAGWFGPVYALDAGSGEEQWRLQTGDWVESSPAVVDGTVYVGGFDGNVYALSSGLSQVESAGIDIPLLSTSQELYIYNNPERIVLGGGGVGGVIWYLWRNAKSGSDTSRDRPMTDDPPTTGGTATAATSDGDGAEAESDHQTSPTENELETGETEDPNPDAGTGPPGVIDSSN